MTLPPHGPPEITEAQQAATSLGEVADPTPDNVSRALQDYSPYAVAAAAASIGASGGGGGGSLPDPFVVEGTDPDEVVGKFVAAADQNEDLLQAVGDGDVPVLQVDNRGRTTIDAYNSGLTVARGSLSVQSGAANLAAADAAGVQYSGVSLYAGTVAFLSTYPTVAGYFIETGPVIKGTHAAPDDGALEAGDCALWFDQTDGAAKLKIKAKTADGTVVAGEIALT